MKTKEQNNSMVLLQGAISKIKRSRRSYDFVLNEVQHQQISATAIAASALGMSAAAMGLISMAGNTAEEADWVEFEIYDKKIRGWLWMMPMYNGDNVEVAAEHIGNDHYIAYAVKRDEDNLLAVYPHATAGRMIHYRKSIKTWISCSLLAYLSITILLLLQQGWKAFLNPNIQFVLITTIPLFFLTSGLIALRISWKFMGFVKIAEIIFNTFGWPDVQNIDLRKTSRENRGTDKISKFGNFYFRYK